MHKRIVDGFIRYQGQRLKVNYIPAESLKVDLDNYQREPTRSKVNRIKSRFNWEDFGVIYVTRRWNGDLYILDGSHRVLAVKEKFGNMEVPCWIQESQGIAWESDKFLGYNLEKKNTSPLEHFNAAYGRGDSWALDVKNITVRCGYILPENGKKVPAWNAFRGTGELVRIYKQHGSAHLATVLDLLRESFEGDGNAVKQEIVAGTSRFIADHPEIYGADMKKVSVVFKSPGLSGVSMAAEGMLSKASGGKPEAISQALTMIWEKAQSTKPRGRPRKTDSPGRSSSHGRLPG